MFPQMQQFEYLKVAFFFDIHTSVALLSFKIQQFCRCSHICSKHCIIPLEKDVEMKQRIIIFSEQINQIQNIYILPIKQTWKIYKTHFQKISSQSDARRLGIVRIEVYIHILKCPTNFIQCKVIHTMAAYHPFNSVKDY